ncbi:MAG: T9SS type A sorting domain-containing protein [bacterium]|nr:T9SS type A sorting domain-containing protein [bacterium]
MRKIMMLVTLFVPLCAFADNVIFNDGFDMVPWDTGWVKETSTDTSTEGNGQATAIATIEASDSAVSSPHSCNLRTYISCGHMNGVYGAASAETYASITQTFNPISNCLFKLSVIDSFWGMKNISDYPGIEICINGNWENVYGYVVNNNWAEICTTITTPDTLTGVRVSSYQNDGRAGVQGWICVRDEKIWVDDIQVMEIGIEEKLNIKTPSTTLRASPNPFTQSTVINYSASGESEKSKIQIYDIAGKLVETTKNNIIGGNLKTGIYFIKVNDYLTADRHVKPLKIVKMSCLQ